MPPKPIAPEEKEQMKEQQLEATATQSLVTTVRRIVDENAEKLHEEVDWISVYGELLAAVRAVDAEARTELRRAPHARAKRKWRSSTQTTLRGRLLKDKP